MTITRMTCAFLTLTAFLASACHHPTTAAASASLPVAAAPGRLEGCDRTVDVGVSASGVLETLHVHQGDMVARGQVLAEIDCGDAAARARAAAAYLEDRENALTRLLRGARDEERRASGAAMEAARADRDKAVDRRDRLRHLAEQDQVVSREAVIQAELDARASEAAVDVAEAQFALALADPVPEDVARARAGIASARAELAAAEATVRQCSVVAPADGTVLRTLVEAGEMVAVLPPTPVLQIADLSCWRVRAEVDERDIARIALGARVSIRADAWGDDVGSGFVTELSPLMGRRSVRSADPAEKSDRDVREVVATLDSGTGDRVVGLRVTVIFTPD